MVRTLCQRQRKKQPHRRETTDSKYEDKVAIISMDYFFTSQEEEKALENPLMVMVDESTGNRHDSSR